MSLFIKDIYIACVNTAVIEQKIIFPTIPFLDFSPNNTEKEAKVHIKSTNKGELSLLCPSAKNSFLILLEKLLSG